MLQNKLHRMLDTVLNPQGKPISRERPESTFIRISRYKKTDGDGSQQERSMTLAPRLDTLEGKTVYLVDESFGGGQEFLKEMRDWFSGNMPSVKTVLRKKRGNMFVDDPELWSEIREKGDAMILGVGG